MARPFKGLPLSARISLGVNLLMVLACGVILLQNRALRHGVENAHGSATLLPGARIAPFAYVTLGGEPATLAFDSHKPYLLFVISTTCSWCERSLPQIQAISRSVDRNRIYPLTVSIHDPSATMSFAAAQHVDFELVCAAASDEFQQANGIEGVPTTILLDGKGVVLQVWEGDITPDLAKKIEAAAERSAQAARDVPGVSGSK